MTQPHILKDAYVSVNGTDISASVTTVNLGTDNEGHDASAMGDATRSEVPGMKVISCSLDLNQDFSNGGIDELLYNLWNDQTIFAVHIRPKKAELASQTNPQYGFYAFLKNYSPLGGSVGDKITTSIELTPAKDGVNLPDLTRSTS